MKKPLIFRFYGWYFVGMAFVTAIETDPPSPDWVTVLGGITFGLLMWLHDYDCERTR